MTYLRGPIAGIIVAMVGVMMIHKVYEGFEEECECGQPGCPKCEGFEEEEKEGFEDEEKEGFEDEDYEDEDYEEGFEDDDDYEEGFEEREKEGFGDEVNVTLRLDQSSLPYVKNNRKIRRIRRRRRLRRRRR